MIDMLHAPLPTQDEAKWQLDFLGRWKGKKYFIYSEGAVELHGHPLLHPEGRFSKDQIRDQYRHPQSGRPESDALRYLHLGRKERLIEIRGKVIEQMV